MSGEPKTTQISPDLIRYSQGIVTSKGNILLEHWGYPETERLPTTGICGAIANGFLEFHREGKALQFAAMVNTLGDLVPSKLRDSAFLTSYLKTQGTSFDELKSFLMALAEDPLGEKSLGFHTKLSIPISGPGGYNENLTAVANAFKMMLQKNPIGSHCRLIGADHAQILIIQERKETVELSASPTQVSAPLETIPNKTREYVLFDSNLYSDIYTDPSTHEKLSTANVITCDIDLASLLLAHGFLNKSFAIPYNFSLANGYPITFDFANSDFSIEDQTVLLGSILESSLSTDLNPTQLWSGGKSFHSLPLIAAAALENIARFDLLLEHGANPFHCIPGAANPANSVSAFQTIFQGPREFNPPFREKAFASIIRWSIAQAQMPEAFTDEIWNRNFQDFFMTHCLPTLPTGSEAVAIIFRQLFIYSNIIKNPVTFIELLASKLTPRQSFPLLAFKAWMAFAPSGISKELSDRWIAEMGGEEAFLSRLSKPAYSGYFQLPEQPPEQLAETIGKSILNSPETLPQWISFLMTKESDYRLEFLKTFVFTLHDSDQLQVIRSFFSCFMARLEPQEAIKISIACLNMYDNTRNNPYIKTLLKNLFLDCIEESPASRSHLALESWMAFTPRRTSHSLSRQWITAMGGEEVFLKKLAKKDLSSFPISTLETYRLPSGRILLTELFKKVSKDQRNLLCSSSVTKGSISWTTSYASPSAPDTSVTAE